MPRLLVLGAKSDIARAAARRFAEAGFDLYLAARGSEWVKADASDIEVRFGVKAEAVEFDALDYSSHKAFYESLEDKPLGVLCAVGYLGSQEKAQDDFDEALKIMNTNYTACVSILEVIARDFEERRKGFIIIISSVAGDRGRQSNYFYGSGKAALTAYASGLRNRLFRSGIQVITVKPGFVRTRMTEGLDLPEKLTAEPEHVAADIFSAYEKKKNIIYTKWFWRFVMFIIRNIPERVFKSMRL